MNVLPLLGCAAGVLAMCGVAAMAQSDSGQAVEKRPMLTTGGTPAPTVMGEVLDDGTMRAAATDPRLNTISAMIPDGLVAPEGPNVRGLCVLCKDGDQIENEIGLPTDTTNGGCNSSPFVFGSARVGVPICGRTGSDGSRDTDWYVITLKAGVSYTIRGVADIGAVFGMVSADGVNPRQFTTAAAFCAGASQLGPFLLTSACIPIEGSFSVSVTGNYVLFAATDFSAGQGYYRVVVDTCFDCTGDYEEVPFEIANLDQCDQPGWDPTNGGCADTLFLPFGTLRLGVPLCGAGALREGALGTCRDTDWYRLSVFHAGLYEIQLTTDFNAYLGVMEGGTGVQFISPGTFCPAFFFDAHYVTGCSTGSLYFDAPGAGTYIVFVGSDFTEFTPDGRYRLVARDLCQTCPGDLDCDGDVDLGDLNILLSRFGQDCGTPIEPT